MAENQKTYRATIDVDTKDAAKNMDLLEKKLNTSLGEFDNLNEAISKTQDTLGKLDPNSKAFKELSKELQGLKDDLKDTEIQSSRFTEALAAQPGVMGLVGQSLEGLRGTMKVFMANPIIAVISAIAGAFLAMRESLTKTSEGQETLNRISAAFGKIMGPIFAVIEKVALPLFNGLAWVIEKAANAFNRAARFFGASQAKIEEASRNSSEVLKTSYEEEMARQAELSKVAEEESQKRIETTEKEVKVTTQKREEASKKVIDIARKEAEELARIREQAAGIQLEAELSLLDDRARAIKEREMRYNEELKVLKAAGYTDFTALEGEYYKDLFEIRKQYDNNVKVEVIKAKDAELKITEFTGQAMVKVNTQTAEANTEITKAEQETKMLIISNTLGMIADAVGRQTVAGKALAVAQATIDTYMGATKALATYPPPFGAIAAATVIAAGLLNVKKIISTKIPPPPQLPGRSSGGGGSSSASGGGSVPTPPTVSITPPQIQTAGGFEANTGSQIAESIASSQQRPIKAYVVSEEVSSKQALDRRTNDAATLG